jgi:hypothetical protein
MEQWSDPDPGSGFRDKTSRIRNTATVCDFLEKVRILLALFCYTHQHQSSFEIGDLCD